LTQCCASRRTPTCWTPLSQLVIVPVYLLPAAHNDTDIVERARRERPLELPAEKQWSMLPIRA